MKKKTKTGYMSAKWDLHYIGHPNYRFLYIDPIYKDKKWVHGGKRVRVTIQEI